MQDVFGGKGWKFPVQVDRATGRIRLSDVEADIAEAIRLILSTSKGERVMRPKFGCNLKEYMFAGTDGTSLSLLKSDIAEAIAIWEPRVRDVQVDASVDRSDPSKLNVSIRYTTRATNQSYSLIYPMELHGPGA
ncbi:GPW/gp25 family protein [Brevibacillus borstelensis]|uniref:GPW/gp25 family protein n=1 Tax=Brevibacillus borstelensis TaxID=45462 RepID=UPI0030C0DD43